MIKKLYIFWPIWFKILKDAIPTNVIMFATVEKGAKIFKFFIQLIAISGPSKISM
jgi:hypothetical protein